MWSILCVSHASCHINSRKNRSRTGKDGQYHYRKCVPSCNKCSSYDHICSVNCQGGPECSTEIEQSKLCHQWHMCAVCTPIKGFTFITPLFPKWCDSPVTSYKGKNLPSVTVWFLMSMAFRMEKVKKGETTDNFSSPNKIPFFRESAFGGGK